MTGFTRPISRDVHLDESSSPLDPVPARPCRIAYVCQSIEARPCLRCPHVYHLPALRITVFEGRAILHPTQPQNRGGNTGLLLGHDRLPIHSGALNHDGSADSGMLLSRSLPLALYPTRVLPATTLTTRSRLDFPSASDCTLFAQGGVQ
jgi:hypothetical protein